MPASKPSAASGSIVKVNGMTSATPIVAVRPGTAPTRIPITTPTHMESSGFH